MTRKRRRAPEKRQSSVFDEARIWSIDKAAAHYGYRRETILRYIREGHITVHEGGYIDREELLAEVQRRTLRQQATRAKRPEVPGL